MTYPSGVKRGIARLARAAMTSAGEIFTSHLLAAFLAEQAARPGDENADHDNEGIGVPEVRRDVAGAEGFDQPQEQAADHRAGEIAEAADHADHESLQAEAAPHRRFGEENRRHEQSG